jgi:hypothetical protein
MSKDKSVACNAGAIDTEALGEPHLTLLQEVEKEGAEMEKQFLQGLIEVSKKEMKKARSMGRTCTRMNCQGLLPKHRDFLVAHFQANGVKTIESTTQIVFSAYFGVPLLQGDHILHWGSEQEFEELVKKYTKQPECVNVLFGPESGLCIEPACVPLAGLAPTSVAPAKFSQRLKDAWLVLVGAKAPEVKQ